MADTYYIYDCSGYDRFGNPGQGFLIHGSAISGELLGTFITQAQATLLHNLGISATWYAGQAFSGSSPSLALAISADFYVGVPKGNWVKWSNIGEFDFTIDKKNTAGEMPMEWPGTVLAVMKLGAGVVVYGSGGVTQMVPKDNVWSPKMLTNVGIKSEWSIAGNQYLHVWIDKRGRLCTISDKLEILDYAEFLSSMGTNTVLSFDESKQLVFICDGTSGYVYSIEDKSLGTCPPKITGVGYNQGTLQIVGSGALVTATFEIITDLIDAGTRSDKTLQELEIGTNSAQDLEASVDYSLSYKGSLVSTPWQLVSPSGIAVIPCFGKEFKVRLRAKAATALELDYLRLKGFIHGYSPVDS